MQDVATDTACFCRPLSSLPYFKTIRARILHPFDFHHHLNMASPTLESKPTAVTPVKRVFYRTTWFAAIVLGMCNFAAPGMWVGMSVYEPSTRS